MWLMSSPVTPALLLAGYLHFVLSSGPKWMRHRKPFNIDWLLIVYNALQIVGCAYLVFLVSIHLATSELPHNHSDSSDVDRCLRHIR